MLNKIWFGLLCIGIVYGFGKGGLSIGHRREACQPQPMPTRRRRCEAEAKRR